MPEVARYAKATAKGGEGDALGAVLLRVAELLEEAPGCLINLESVEDQAPKHGISEMGEARFARTDLGAVDTGVSHQRLRPNRRQGFGHRHYRAEEVYVVLAGSGRVRIDDEIHDVRQLDAIRIAPGSTRALEAGPEGLEVLVVGPHVKADGEIFPDFWPAGT